jgi:N utilization substance protein A
MRPRRNIRESEIANTIEQLHREKGIPKAKLIEIFENAILHAAQKALGVTRELEVSYDPSNPVQEITIFEYKTIVEEVTDENREITMSDAEGIDETSDLQIGDEIGIPLDIHPQDLGRIPAQAASNYLKQHVRQAERDIIFEDFEARKGELVTGIVRRYERDRDNVILELGRAEAILRKRHQIRKETYRPGESIQAYLLDINHSSRGPNIELSRTHNGLVVKLFELGVPEIKQGLVSIESCARVPGERAKIAVRSLADDVDPVGACVGIRGSRVQDVVRSLNGEAIDIVLWSEDPLIYVKGAIAPADMVKGVLYYDETDRINVEVIVPDNQLSKAIGRRGQNVKLASQLTGFKIDVFSEADYSEIIDAATEQLQRIEGLSEEQIEILLQHRYHTIAQVYDEETVEMAEILEIDEASAKIIIDNAATALDQLTEEEKQARLQAEQKD